MPIYEYECPACDQIFELQQKISEAPMSLCPECGGDVKKLVSMSSFQLKGNGWYSDGYSGPSNGKNGKTAPVATSSAPPCQGGGAACSNCPASTT